MESLLVKEVNAAPLDLDIAGPSRSSAQGGVTREAEICAHAVHFHVGGWNQAHCVSNFAIMGEDNKPLSSWGLASTIFMKDLQSASGTSAQGG